VRALPARKRGKRTKKGEVVAEAREVPAVRTARGVAVAVAAAAAAAAAAAGVAPRKEEESDKKEEVRYPFFFPSQHSHR